MTASLNTKSTLSPGAAIRAKLNYPVIDTDGHVVEFIPTYFDYLRQVGGPKMVEHYQKVLSTTMGFNWYDMDWAERKRTRTMRPIWWGVRAKHTIDRATATLPRLLAERLEEFGIDYTILYPSIALFFPLWEDEELRKASTRALNLFYKDVFAGYERHMTPAALINMNTPQEAIEELEFVVKECGHKAIMMGNGVFRPIPSANKPGEPANPHAKWLDNFVMDSAYNYDPVWAKMMELKVTPTFHGQGMGYGSRASISNFCYNHIGHFAEAHHHMAKGMIMSGVTKRFPKLSVGFLECGVAWACSLYSDLVGHYVKRNKEAMDELNPDSYDRPALQDFIRRYGPESFQKHVGDMFDVKYGFSFVNRVPDEDVDEWKDSGITKPEDIYDLFVKNFYFGCEADDPTNATAFNSKVNPFGARLKAVFSSDLGHFDVERMNKIVAEAYELVERELVTEDDFRDFVFTNVATMRTDMNPDFFKGTNVEDAVKKFILPKAAA